ncbi:universal stress protein [Acrocarpospora pleiomorpha]|uniref:Universal stress protein n=1 Tax=Acrocarpospora pleiomorpha TaxID=90975 RepID=A0A5M3XN14_9ACTN|nr:universal stress protein [Acrocarpospora pleiomorpha]GES21041.1 universal stress protein [Acrocarpospora pleiomorpha]
MKDVIVVGVDGSPASLAAVEWATDDAVRTRAALRIVFVLDRYPYEITRFPDHNLGDQLARGAARILDKAEQTALARSPGIAFTREIIEGRPAEVLRELAAGAAELVVGTRGMGGFARAILGSVSSHVAGHAPGPVVVVNRLPETTRGEVVVGVDDSPACRPALAYAFEQARLRGSAVRALHAWQVPVHAFAPEISYDMDEIRTAQHAVVTGLLDRYREEYPDVKVIEDVHSAHPVEALVDASGGADLLVVGSHGRGALGAVVLGSVSRGVLHHARCPVAVVRPRA